MASSTSLSVSAYAHLVAETYAVISPANVSSTKVFQWLNKAHRQTSGERGLQQAEFKEAVQELVAANVLEPSVDGTTGEPARGPRIRFGHVTQFCESALKRGTYTLILDELNDTIYQPFYYQRIQSVPEQLLEQYARLALLSNNFEKLDGEYIPSSAWLWLTEPKAAAHLRRLHQPYCHQACIYGLAYLAHYLQPIKAFAKLCRDINPGNQVEALIARSLVFQGAFKKARTVLSGVEADPLSDKMDFIECSSLRALMASLEGDDAAAMQFIEATITIERGDSRKRVLYPDTFSFGCALFSLLRLATPESRALFNSLMEARDKLHIESDLEWPLIAAASADKPRTSYQDQVFDGPACIITVLYAIASRWHKDYHYPDNHPSVVAMLNTIGQVAQAGEYHWVAAEIHTVIEANLTDDKTGKALMPASWQDTTAAERHKKLGTSTLTKLVATMEPWELSLRELEQLALKTKPSKAKSNAANTGKSKRLIWKFIEIYDNEVEINPLEQSQGKNGQWTGGRRVALKRLKEQAASMTHLSAQDVKAGAAIQKVTGGWNTSVGYETDQRTVFALIGHPYIYDEDEERYDIVEQPPLLTISEVNESLKLSITPEYNGAHYRTQLDTANRRITATHFTAAHRRIAEAVPVKGLVVPSGAKDRLQAMLDTLATDISVQGNNDASQGKTIAGSPEPLLSMEPFGDSLRVRIRVEPLASSGSYFDAGAGGAVVYVQSDKGSVAVQRDLAEERTRVEAMVLNSDVLAQHYDGRSFFIIDDTVDALELLEDVSQAGVRCIWPSDIPFRIKAKADVAQVSLNIKSAKDWFSAKGTVDIDDQTTDPLTLAHLLKLMQAQPDSRFIELSKGDFLSLSTTLKQQLDTLAAFSKVDTKATESHNIHPLALLSLEPLLNNATVQADKSLKARRKQINLALQTDAPVPSSLQAELRTYQHEGFVWLERLGRLGAGACLADDMGLGKTVQTLALFLSRAEQGPALVVAPTSVVGNWMQEAQRFAPSLNVISYGDTQSNRQDALANLGPFDLLLVSYGLMARNIEPLQSVHWNTVVLDEAQAIKNTNTQRAKAARQLSASFRVVLTGTPVQNNLMDLHSLYSFINPQLVGSEAQFRKRFAVPISRDNDEQARAQLQQLISPFLLRRHKRDVLKELPARTELTLNVKLSKEEFALYDLIRQEALDSITSKSDTQQTENLGQQKIIILSYLTKLRRLCCNPSLISPDWNGPMSKLDVFSDTLSELIESGHKALVFSQFVDHLKIIEAHLQDKGISYQYLDGSTSAKQRTERVAKFQGGEGNVFLISLTAGGVGLNLTAADYVIHLDPWWNPAVEDQASDRAHRMGQQRPVTIVRMVTSNTIEEQIQELHSNKRELADSVLSGADAPKLDIDTMVRLLRATSNS